MYDARLPSGKSEVLKRLDRLPLAVSQAAFYMRETTASFEGYLTKLHNEKRCWRLLAAAGPSRHRQEDVQQCHSHVARQFLLPQQSCLHACHLF
jgi:hypothetical protein